MRVDVDTVFFSGVFPVNRVFSKIKMATVKEKNLYFVLFAEIMSAIVELCKYVAIMEAPLKPTTCSGSCRLAVCYREEEVDGPLSAMGVSN